MTHGASKLETHGPLVIEALGRVFTMKAACALAEVDTLTVRRWIQRGEAAPEGDPYRTFANEAQRARVKAVGELEERVRKVAKDADLPDLLKVLERLSRDDWGRHDKLTVDGTLTVEHAAPVIAETFERLLALVPKTRHAEAERLLDEGLAVLDPTPGGAS